MRKLSTEKRASILSALVEGSSVNATARMCGVSKVTILRLLADAGTYCAQYHDLYVQDLPCTRVQADELWSWTYVGICTETKFVVSWLPGEKSPESASDFMADLRSRLACRIQLETDGNKNYYVAVPDAFGQDVDYGMLIKIYGDPKPDGSVGATPVTVIGTKRKRIIGNPNVDQISTSYVERQNLTVRMGNRRFTRSTNAFSKILSNHCFALSLHYWWYNWGRKHQTLKTTPAVAIGLTNRAFTMVDLVKMIEEEEVRIGGRITDYLPASTTS